MIASLVDELAASVQAGDGERDAARYRWLRDEAVWRADPDGKGEMLWAVVGTRHDDCTPIDGTELDAAVDERLAAIQADTARKEGDPS